MTYPSFDSETDAKVYSTVDAYKRNTRLAHSGVGIASFIISVVMACIIFMLVVIAGVMEVSTPGGINEESVGAIILGMFILGALAITFIALIMGVIGLFQYDRKKLFAILGTVISVMTLLSAGGLMIMGILTG